MDTYIHIQSDRHNECLKKDSERKTGRKIEKLRWVNRPTERQRERQTDGWMNKYIHKQRNSQKLKETQNEREKQWQEERQLYGWMEGGRTGQIDRWMEGWID